MDFFFDPKGVAVVGATPEPYSSGRNLLMNLTLGYQGPVYPVNPKYKHIDNHTCFAGYQRCFGPRLDLDPCPDCASGFRRVYHKRCPGSND